MKYLQTYKCMLDEGIHAENTSRFVYFFFTKIKGDQRLEHLHEYDLILVQDGK